MKLKSFKKICGDDYKCIAQITYTEKLWFVKEVEKTRLVFRNAVWRFLDNGLIAHEFNDSLDAINRNGLNELNL